MKKADEKLKDKHDRVGPIGWLKSRFGYEPIAKYVVYHRVTKEPWYYGGGAALLLMLFVLVVTGMFLTLDYSASPATAYESVVLITKQNSLGWLVRALHYWAAGMMLLLLLWHVLRHVLLGGYLPPREGTWLVGVLMFFLVVINAFLGYTLRWDERAIYAMRVALHHFYSVPIIGDELVRFVQGGWHLGASTLSRFYSVHIIFVPFLLLALTGYHMYLVILYGVTTAKEQVTPPPTAAEQIKLAEHEENNPKTGTEFYPYTVKKSGYFALVSLIVVFSLALILGPQELEPKANLVETAFPREEWWWSWYSALVSYLPPWLAPTFYFLFPILLFAALAGLPFVDRSSNRGIRRRPIAVLSVVFIVSALLALTGLRLNSPWTAWPKTTLPPIPPGVELTESVQRGRALFTEYGCFNCHAIGGHGSQFAPNLTGLDVRLSKSELEHYVLEPPADVAMPSYRDRISPEDLERIVDFVLVAQTFPREYKAPDPVDKE